MADWLLPRNATPFEQAVTQVAKAALEKMDPFVTDMRGKKLTSPPPSWLPYLVYEYGLQELTPFVPNLYTLIEEGIRWQRVRGTPDAVSRGLEWVGYAGDIEEFPTRRKKWNLFMLALDRLRDQEEPDLFRIDGIADLSTPLRSYYWRGFHGYDIRALDLGYTKLSSIRLASFSGTRIEGVRSKWSYGRDRFHNYLAVEADLDPLGVWIDPTATTLGWGGFTWEAAGASWEATGEGTRKSAIASGLSNRPVWIELRNTADEVIGYRRCRYARPVKPDPDGEYLVDGVRYAIAPTDATAFVVEALTSFDTFDGEQLGSWGVVFDATVVDGEKPGLWWAMPEQIELIRPVENLWEHSEPQTVSEFRAGPYGFSSGQISMLAPGDMTGFDGGVQYPAVPTTLIFAISEVLMEVGKPYVFSFYVEMDDGSAPVYSDAGGAFYKAGDDFAISLGGEYTPQPGDVKIEHVSGPRYRVSLKRTAVVSEQVGIYKNENHRAVGFKASGFQITRGDVTREYIKSTGAPTTVNQNLIGFDNRIAIVNATDETLGATIRERFQVLLNF